MKAILHEKLRHQVLHTFRQQHYGVRYQEIKHLKQENWDALHADLTLRLRRTRWVMWVPVVLGLGFGLVIGWDYLSQYAQSGAWRDMILGMGYVLAMVGAALFSVYRDMNRMAEIRESLLCLDLLREQEPKFSLN